GLGALFNRPTSIAVDSGVCAISLRDMPPEHVAAATLIVARWLWELVRRDRRRRHIVFDEVGALCVHRPLRDLLVQLARRCRKYSASLVVEGTIDRGLFAIHNSAGGMVGESVAAMASYRFSIVEEFAIK